MTKEERLKRWHESHVRIERALKTLARQTRPKRRMLECVLRVWLAPMLALYFATGCTLEVQDPYGGTARVTIGDGGATPTDSATASIEAKPTIEAPTGLVEIGGEKVKPGLAKLFAAINRALRLKRYREGRDIAQGLARAFGAALHKSGSGGSSAFSGRTSPDRKPPKSDTELRSDDAFNDMRSVIEESK